MRDDMEPSVTMKSFVPLLFTPVMVFTRAAAVATMERPGSMITVRPISLACSRIVSSSSLQGLRIDILLSHVPATQSLVASSSCKWHTNRILLERRTGVYLNGYTYPF